MRHGRRHGRRRNNLLSRFLAVGLGLSALLLATCAGAAQGVVGGTGASDPRLEKSYRFQQGGWTYVHLEGAPADIGFQHGYLLSAEIADALEAIKLADTHQT